MLAVKIMSRILKLLTILSFSALIVVVLMQVTGRYTPVTFVWTEELSRFLFIFSIAFAAPVAMEKREYVRVDLLISILPEKIRRYYDALIYLVLGIFSASMINYAYQFSLAGQNQSSATLTVKMFYIYSSMTIIFIFLALYSFLNIYHVIKQNSEKGVEQ
ncbi:TRAP transporter small permease [Pseudalkalibacillus salsuginis]|uniref:TRAP transporter small permease n=1 Tax=Pseudalkalibacillus salsuginis TaxID=2910972 RepID=UPI001F340D70|nr:TRAP transporter small permease [Pseudalkalibacillus salsuginis]MCF6410055.1 TRAP transporter small permease [Pseudalkalibacillus salsuginis]